MGCRQCVFLTPGHRVSLPLGPLGPVAGGVRLACRLTPKSSRSAIDGLHIAADGAVALKARVTAAPEKGKANKALIKLLARETGLAPSTMAVIAGAQSRNKMILFKGEPQHLEKILAAWLESFKE